MTFAVHVYVRTRGDNTTQQTDGEADRETEKKRVTRRTKRSREGKQRKKKTAKE